MQRTTYMPALFSAVYIIIFINHCSVFKTNLPATPLQIYWKNLNYLLQYVYRVYTCASVRTLSQLRHAEYFFNAMCFKVVMFQTHVLLQS